MCTHLTALLAASTALQEPGPTKQGGGAGDEGAGEREDPGCPLCITVICKLQELDPNGEPGGGTALDVCVAGLRYTWLRYTRLHGLRYTRLHEAADFRLRSQPAALTSITPERDLMLGLTDLLCVPF